MQRKIRLLETKLQDRRLVAGGGVVNTNLPLSKAAMKKAKNDTYKSRKVSLLNQSIPCLSQNWGP